MKPQSLTNDELDDWIASKTGWTSEIINGSEYWNGPKYLFCSFPPDYCTDLAAMSAEANRLQSSEFKKFKDLVWLSASITDPRNWAEAFYIVKGGDR